MKMPSYQYGEPHYKDKMVAWVFIFEMEITITENMIFILKWDPGNDPW